MELDGGLPRTLVSLRRLLVQRTLSIAEALSQQAITFAGHAARYGCVVSAHDPCTDGTRQGVLAGIGLAHKDVFDLPGRAPGCGSTIAVGAPPARAALAIDHLAAAGAANLAALQMAQFACGATGENSQGAEPVNPIDAHAVVGGSSSGSAAAVAAGLCYASLGTDTAGSIRIPAATCGLIGLKPTLHRIPTRGVFPLAPSLDGVGIIARSAGDIAAILAVLDASGRPGDPSVLAHEGHWHVTAALPSTGLASDVHAALDAFVDSLRATARVRTIELTDFDAINDRAEVVLYAEAAGVHRQRLVDEADRLSATVKAIAWRGLAVPGPWYAEAKRSRPRWTHRFCATALTGVDLLLMPALARGIPDWAAVHTQSPDFDAEELRALHRFMPFANYLGLPSLVFPIGVDTRGRPVCIQAVARPYAERTLLAFAHEIEAERYGSNGFVVRSRPVPARSASEKLLDA